jgi:hypothetical protein
VRDDEPIVVKDYGVLFAKSLLVLLAIVILLTVLKFAEEDFATTKSSIRTIGVIACAIYILLLIVVKIPRRFHKIPSYFEFSNDCIKYCEFDYERKQKTILTTKEAQIQHLKQVSFCVVTELYQRFGRKHHLSAWKMFRKSAIAIPLTKLFCFTYYLITFLFFALPFKIYKLKKAKEPLSLLKKNIVIEFTNRNYFLVNIYSQREFDELMIYFKSKNIPIQDKTVFLHHWQIVNPTFFDKNERWRDECEEETDAKKSIWWQI